MLLRSTKLFKSFQLLSFRHFRQSSTWAVTPRVFPNTGFKNIPVHEKLEEENYEWYTPNMFYPVTIGDIFNSRYQVLYKLGYGTTSTVWMCRDLQIDKYVCMKAMGLGESSVNREIKAHDALCEEAYTETLKATHLVRYALDHFVLQIHDRNYNFLIHEPLGLALQHFLEASNHKGVHPGFVKLLGFYILKGLQFMHSAKVVHTDISPTKILMTLLDKSIYKEGEEEELNEPSARKILEDSIIFETRELPGSMRRWVDVKAIPIICDFGEARTGSDLHEGPVQPLPYKAPEVLLHLPWYTALDVWSFGCLMWQLVVGDHLFPREKNPDRPQEADRNHLGLMVALLGLPPRTLLQRSGTRADIFYNEDGSFKGEVPNVTLESTLASSLKGNNKEVMTPDECQLFLALMRRTLTWSQEDRATADELLKDPWISS